MAALVKVNLTGTYIWNGVKYGPRRGASVPADLAAFLGMGEGTAPPEAKPARTPADLPEDFPERDLLTGTAFTTLDALQAASDEDLLAVDGIGPAKLKAIRAYGK